MYPFYQELHDIARGMQTGNFGLWYNKMVPNAGPGRTAYKACDDRGDVNKAKWLYSQRYGRISRSAGSNLQHNHLNQYRFCTSMSNKGCRVLTITAKLTTPLLTGVGQSHLSETSLVFDHTSGLPFIPSSTVKGVVRLGHLINKIAEEKDRGQLENHIFRQNGHDYIDDEAEWTKVPELFGTQEQRGKVVFLDTYPIGVPSVREDILNPHYNNYYQNDLPPVDNCDPVPVTFLTVAPETVFVFRVVFSKDLSPEASEYCTTAFRRILTEDGIGSKTALGYGRFAIIAEEEPREIQNIVLQEEARLRAVEEEKKRKSEEEALAQKSPDERMIFLIEKLSADSQAISDTVKKCLDGGFSSEVYKALKEKLQELKQWSPSQFKNKKKKAKIQNRNQDIEALIS